MNYNQCLSLCLIALVAGQAAALPQHSQYPQQYQQSQVNGERKFAEKPNALKKVAKDDLSDISTNHIEESSGGFSWSNMLGMLMQMILGQTSGLTGAGKNELDDSAPPSPWENLFSVGLRVLTALLGGNQQSVDGIDKVDNPSSSMQDLLTAVLGAFLGQGRNPVHVAEMAKNASEFINIVMNLLNALKTSFSHRSLTARSLGKRDTLSEAAVASLSMLKYYMKSLKAFNNVGRAADEGQRGCAERAVCEANAECAADSQGASPIFCQFGSYATSYLLQGQSGVGFDALYEAGRRGRSGEDCRTLFMDCNAA